jgi:hypothetical protein
LNAITSHKRCVSNRMLRNQIQMIAFITFLNDEIVVQEYIFGAKVPYTCMIISKMTPHNKDFPIRMKVMCLSLL